MPGRLLRRGAEGQPVGAAKGPTEPDRRPAQHPSPESPRPTADSTAPTYSKEQLRAIFASRDRAVARALLAGWIAWARRGRLPAFVKLAKDHHPLPAADRTITRTNPRKRQKSRRCLTGGLLALVVSGIGAQVRGHARIFLAQLSDPLDVASTGLSARQATAFVVGYREGGATHNIVAKAT